MIDFSTVCAEREEPRQRHEVVSELCKLIPSDSEVWELIDELEERMWREAFDEGYMYGHQQGWDGAEVMQ